MDIRPVAVFTCAALLLGTVHVAPAPRALAGPQDEAGGEEKDEGALRKTVKARRLLESSRWLDQTKSEILAGVQAREDKGQIPAGATENFEKVADWNGLLDLAVASYVKNMDEEVMDAAIVFYESPKGKRFAEAQPEMAKTAAGVTRDWVTETTLSVVSDLSGSDLADKAKGLFNRFKKPDLKKNEEAAIAVLRALTQVQARTQTSGKIDADLDGIGEYGTLMEMAGAVGTRTHTLKSKNPEKHHSGLCVDFEETGAKLAPPFAPVWEERAEWTGAVDENGIAVHDGYCFRVFLVDGSTGHKPETRSETRAWAHESGPASAPGVKGASNSFHVDWAEINWCAYAWPEEVGKTGQRVFFVDQGGVVVASSNETARWSGKDRPVPPEAAYSDKTSLAKSGPGVVGTDKETWSTAK